MHGHQLVAWQGEAASPAPATYVLACGSWRGRYHTDWHLGAALQNTAMCPAAPPPDAACAAGQSHNTQDTVIRPGPHSCPFWHRSG
jgi:hypothetical protein